MLPVIADDDSLPPRRVLLAAPRGYCAGVDRAVVAVQRALKIYGAPVYVRKQIVHNRHVVAELEQDGAVFVEELDEVPVGAHVVFSAHGVAPSVVAEAEQRELQAIDATCPLVTKVHREAKRYAKQDYDILLIGHRGHEEVEGTSGEAPDHVQIVNDPSEVDKVVVRDPAKTVWLSQTTLSVDETMRTVERLRERFPELVSPPSDDICYATSNRQIAIKNIAARSDLVLVVGSSNSSNTMRLVDVALDHGARTAHRIDFAHEIEPEWLAGVRTIGITSGASVPDVLVDEVLAALAEAGWRDVEEVRTDEEDLTFSLPKELRRDLAAAGEETGLGGHDR
ncbi:4-hydroxy-3-methylbut-2-enyl diphosphate reductase [Pseudoclavibacter sp. CFCC 11306]|uniref:4-hydroxy-3-methylbut-2-enyl diphosphate reductase n=1 Tax=Pseudoclavibacter sp. CFCC 11306 TaxID=1564493 RepID=UPI001CE47FA8|nr:4-hydroxy-3-methylbut-2-enyl diphosphate reductase [Pseudoclavibacter sp. CFCC 11306]